MSEGRPEDTRFSDAETREIFARAADRQEEARRAQADTPGGLTLPELEAIGAEAGIAPDHVAAAAREIVLRREGGVSTARPSSADLLWAERSLPAVPTEDAWERAVHELRDAYGVRGVVSRFGSSLEWASTASGVEGSPVVARVAWDDHGRAHLTLQDDLTAVARMPLILGGSFLAVAVMVGLLLLLSDPEAALPVAGLLGGVAVVGGGLSAAGIRLHRKRRSEKLAAAADRLALVLREGE